MLKRVGIKREECYVTNVMKIQPPGNDFGHFYEDSKRNTPRVELLLGIEEVKREITQIKPNVVVPLGSEPLRAITGLRSIDSWRGSILSSSVGKVVGTYHPAYILRQFGDKPIVELDLKRVKEESSSPVVNVPKPNFLLDPSFDSVMDYLRSRKKGDRIAFDIETTGPIIRCLGLSHSLHQAICIPFMSNPYRFRQGSSIIYEAGPETSGQLNNHYREEEEYCILKELDRVFQDQDIEKVAQNAPFDIGHLAKQFGVICKGLVCDTMVAWHTLFSELPKGLDFLASIFTRVPYYSDHDNSDDLSHWTYNCWDAAVTWEISWKLQTELRSNGLEEFHSNHVQPSLFAATRTENRGILIDEETRTKRREETVKRVEDLKKELQVLTSNPAFNPNSPLQLQKFFYETLKLPIQYSHKRKPDGSRSVTTDKNSRDALAKRFPEHAAKLQLVDQFSSYETLLTGFLNRPVRADGRMYTHFNIAGTRTGRASSSDPIVEVGTNLQNIPIRDHPTFREVFVADPGWSWWKCDLKSAEYMIVMWGANVQRVIQRFLDDPNFSAHKWAASKTYGIPEELVDKKSKEYTYAKNGNYGGNYGMSPAKAALVWHMSEAEAKIILDNYHKLVPEIKGVFWKLVQHMILTSRTITSPMGRKRMFFGRIEKNPSDQDEIFREAYSHYAQNLVGDLINRAWHLLDDILPEDEAKVILQVHDELDVLIRHGYEAKWAPVIKNVMEYPLHFPGVPQPLVIPAELSYGPNWYKQTEWIEGKPINIPQEVSVG